MPLMLGKAESGGEAFLNGLEGFRGELDLVLRAEADKKMVGFFFPDTGIQGLRGLENGTSSVSFLCRSARQREKGHCRQKAFGACPVCQRGLCAAYCGICERHGGITPGKGLYTPMSTPK
jgi:hypothetical protein